MAETFGNLVKGAGYTTISGRIFVSLYTSGSAGNLASMTVYLKLSTAGNAKCAIYDASLNLLTNGETEEKAVPVDDWITFNFPVSPTVAATTSYYLAYWMQNSTRVYRNSAVSDISKYKSVAYNGWPNPLEGATDTVEYPLYATYEEAPPAKKTLIQAALISIPPLIVLPTLSQVLKITGGC